MTERVARACASRPWRVLGGWALAVVVSVVLIGTFLGDALTNTAEVMTPTDSKRADQLVTERMGSGSAPTEMVVVRSPTLTAEDPAFQDQVRRLLQAALATGVLDAAAMATVGVEELPVSPDRQAVLVPLPLRGDDVEPVVELVEAADGQGGFDVELIGERTADRDFQELADQDLAPRRAAVRPARRLGGAAAGVRLAGRGAGPAGGGDRVDRGRDRAGCAGRAGLFAVAVRGQHDHRDGPGPGDRLLAVCPVALPRGTRPRPGGRRRHWGGWGDRQPGGAVQRPGLRPGHDRHGAGARHHPAQPGGRGRSSSGWSRWWRR